MDPWKQFKSGINNIVKNDLSENQVRNDYNYLKNKLSFNKNFSPGHFGQLFFVLNNFKKDKNKISILDHGCSGSISLLFMAMKGYKNLWGVDIDFGNEERLKRLNNLLNIATGRDINSQQRIFLYDGQKLPFTNNYFDFIFSQQVIEHIPKENYLNYLKEEHRTLSENGIVYHQIPHRLVPFEAHTKSWFIHWFPQRISIKLYKIFSINIVETSKYLFLRWPGKLKNDFANTIGPVEIITHKRLNRYVNYGELSYISKFLRKSLSCLAKTPLIGIFLAKMMSPFTMMELVAKKKQ